MIKNYLSVFVLLSVYACNSDVKLASDNQSAQDHILTKTQADIVFEMTKVFPNQTQVSIALIENGVAQFYGIKRVNDTVIGVENKENVFEIGSISKAFTGTLLANAAINNNLDIEDPINNYIDFSLKNDIKISFKALANHTSGLSRMPSNFDSYMDDTDNPFKNYHLKELKEYLMDDLELSKNPGEKNEYSNLGVGLLGYVLASMEKTTYQNLIDEEIFSKYNMSSSTTDRSQVSSKLVHGLNEKGEEVSNWDLSILVGAGGILSTVQDLSKFIIAQFDESNKELALSRIKTFTINEKFDVALGWHIRKNEDKPEWYWHNGGTGGYSSSLVFNTETKNGIVILSNVTAYSENMGNIDSLCFELMKTIEEN
ncbi:MAG: serine hydrolase domain-containing protein [Psychroserpens sp.]|uniref:serine hydrolase domain-containing protein n=1 Tax=Psychroserpens sp. TaxID=2020870 RepID=UPI003001385D